MLRKLVSYKTLLVLTIIGAVLSVYIYISDTYLGGTVCPTGGCAKVAQSNYSLFLTLPVSLWGFSYYLGMSFLNIIRSEQFISKYFNWIYLIGVVWGLLFTIYLRYVEIAYIHAFCIWCWVSVLIIVAMCVITGLIYKYGDYKG